MYIQAGLITEETALRNIERYIKRSCKKDKKTSYSKKIIKKRR